MFNRLLIIFVSLFTFDACASYLPTAVSVANGGTGASTLTSNNVILGNGTTAVQFVAPGAASNILASNGTTWVSASQPIATPLVPGSTAIIDTFAFSYGTLSGSAPCSASPCSYLDQIGTAISNITRVSTGIYNVNTAATYTKLKCVVNSSSTTNFAGGPTGNTACASCNSVQFISVNAASGSVIDTYGTGYCIGSR